MTLSELTTGQLRSRAWLCMHDRVHKVDENGMQLSMISERIWNNREMKMYKFVVCTEHDCMVSGWEHSQIVCDCKLNGQRSWSDKPSIHCRV